MDEIYFSDKPEVAEVLNRLIRRCNKIDEEVMSMKIAIDDLAKRLEMLDKGK